MALRIGTLLAAGAAAALLGGCATYGPGYGYNGYSGYNDYGYNGYDYGPGPAYYDTPGYYAAPSVGVGIGFSDWHGDGHEWHGDRHDHDFHGDRGGHDWHGGHDEHGEHSGG